MLKNQLLDCIILLHCQIFLVKLSNILVINVIVCFLFCHLQFSFYKVSFILLALFFSIFINYMLLGMKLLYISCYVSHHVFFGSVAYPADVILLALFLHALQVMLDFSTEYVKNIPCVI